jgi:hypothetical protein
MKARRSNIQRRKRRDEISKTTPDSTLSTTAQFIDLRPEGIAQRQMLENMKRSQQRDQWYSTIQEKADKSLQSEYIRQLQKKANNNSLTNSLVTLKKDAGIIQLKALSKSKLNVVGEQHDETALEGRLKIEKVIAKEEAGGDYWDESSFKDRDETFFESINIFKGEDKRASADPAILRAAHSCRAAIDGAERLLRYISLKKKVDINDNEITDEILKAYKANYIIIYSGVGTLLKICKEIQTNERWDDMKKEEQNEIKDTDSFAGKISDLIKSTCIKVNSLNKMSDIHDQITTDQELLNKITVELTKAEKIFLKDSKEKWKNELGVQKEESLKGTGTARFLRSMEMNKAATARKDTKGIWKIGTNHISDISANIKSTEYNLLTRDEFNEEYASTYKLPLKK